MAPADLDRRLTALAALGEPLRRTLYHFVGDQDHPVSRDEAAEGIGVSRSTAAFHLDRLVDDGVLAVEFRRLSGRGGPGAGRPAKLYRRAPGDIAVSLPARGYEQAAMILAAAVDAAAAGGVEVETAVRDAARRRGAALAAAVPGPADAPAASLVLAGEGYEPRRCGSEIVLANCPFHALASAHTELVCGMNHALLDGFADALPAASLAARLVPSDRYCCVRLTCAPEPEPGPRPAGAPSLIDAGNRTSPR